MGYTQIGRLSSDVETTFGTDQVESYRDQRFVEGSLKLNLIDARLEDKTVSDRLHVVNSPRDGSQFGSSFDVGLYLDGLAAALNTGAAYSHPQNGIAEILDALMGGNIGAAGSTILAGGGSTATALVVQAGHGPRYSKGGALLCRDLAASALELREVKNRVVDTVTLKMALLGAPADNLDVFNCATFYFDEDDVGGDGDSLMFRILGSLAGNQWLVRGVGGTFSIGLDLDGLVMMTVAARVAAWTKTSGETLAGATYVGGGPLPCNIGNIWYQTSGTTTRNQLRLNKFSIDPGLAIVPQRSPAGVGTVDRWRMVRAKTTCELEAYGFANFDEFWTDFAANTLKSVLIQIGDTPIVAGVGTGVVGLSIPAARFTRSPEITEEDGLTKVKLAFTAEEDQDITSPTAGTGATADLERSKFRVHLA